MEQKKTEEKGGLLRRLVGYLQEGSQHKLFENALAEAPAAFSVDAVDEDERTLVHWAATKGNLDAIKLLVETYGADVDTEDDSQWTPLMSASSAGHLHVVKYLAAHGADLHKRNASRNTALSYACSKGHTDIAAFLLQQKCAPNVKDRYGNTPLHRAAAMGSLAIVKLLVEKKAPLGAVNSAGETALHVAAVEKRVEVLKVLLEAGADPSLATKDGDTARKLAGDSLYAIFDERANGNAEEKK